MRNKGICVLLFLILLHSSALAYSPQENISRIQKAYEGIKDLKGSFVQKSVIKDLRKTEVYKGDFFIKPPLKMKWVYKGKTAQDLIINDDTVLVINKAENQAYRSRFDKSTYGQTPVALLSGFGNIQEEFDISGKGNTLVLKPKNRLGNVVSIKVALSDSGFPIRSFDIMDTHSNEVQIELRDVKINTGLKDSLFNLTIPKDIHVFEQ